MMVLRGLVPTLYTLQTETLDPRSPQKQHPRVADGLEGCGVDFGAWKKDIKYSLRGSKWT